MLTPIEFALGLGHTTSMMKISSTAEEIIRQTQQFKDMVSIVPSYKELATKKALRNLLYLAGGALTIGGLWKLLSTGGTGKEVETRVWKTASIDPMLLKEAGFFDEYITGPLSDIWKKLSRGASQRWEGLTETKEPSQLWWYPLALLSVPLAAYGGSKAVGALLDKYRANKLETELAEAKEQYTEALRAGRGERREKRADFAEALDAMSEAYADGSLAKGLHYNLEKQAGANLNTALGVTLAAMALLAGGSYFGAKRWMTRSDRMRKKLKNVEKVIRWRERMIPAPVTLTREEVMGEIGEEKTPARLLQLLR